jgi:hypothetical protein
VTYSSGLFKHINDTLESARANWTLVVMPYTAWGAQISRDYRERSNITAMREGFILAGTLTAVLLPAAFGLTDTKALLLLEGFFIVSFQLSLPALWHMPTQPNLTLQQLTRDRVSNCCGRTSPSGNCCSPVCSTAFRQPCFYCSWNTCWAGPINPGFIWQSISVPVWRISEAGTFSQQSVGILKWDV